MRSDAAVPAPRVCRSCPTVLSRYNYGPACGRCRLAGDGFLLGRKRGRVNFVRAPRKAGARALPRVGYRPMIAYLEELSDRLMRLDGESEDTDAIAHVIAVMEREAAIP